MHVSKIDHRVEVMDHDEDLVGGPVEDRPILATMFAPLDSSDILVPVAQDEPEGHILALTDEQGMQLLLVLAAQLGEARSVEAIRDAS